MVRLLPLRPVSAASLCLVAEVTVHQPASKSTPHICHVADAPSAGDCHDRTVPGIPPRGTGSRKDGAGSRAPEATETDSGETSKWLEPQTDSGISVANNSEAPKRFIVDIVAVVESLAV